VMTAAVVVTVISGCAFDGDDTPDPGGTQVDWSVAEHELLEDVLAIDAGRHEGTVNFTYVPETRPDGLRRMSAHTADHGTKILDDYDIGPIQILAEFTAEPTTSCEEMNADPGGLLCIRDEKLKVAADEPKMRNVMMYYGEGLKKVSDGDIRKFWSSVKLVPVADAPWFTELLERARAAPKQHFG
jgi:hypothetical protein